MLLSVHSLPVRSTLFGLTLLATTLVGLAAPAQAAPQALDRIVAVVNDDVILDSDLTRAAGLAAGQIKDRGYEVPSDEVLRSQVLERLIMTKIQVTQAQQAGIRVDDRELNDYVAAVAAQNHASVAEFAEMVKREGIDFLAVREQIHDEAVIQRLRQKEVDSHVLVTEQDVNLYLSHDTTNDATEYHVAVILIAVPEGASTETREKAHKKAEEMMTRARGGEDFAKLAIANSDGQQALQGGDLGWRSSGKLPTLFAGVVPRLQLNEISDVIESSSGYNVIKLTGRRNDDARQVVTETHAVHILVKPNKIRDEDATRVQAFELYDRLKGGGDFTALAKEFSDGPGSKGAGGDLGWQQPGVFAPDFQLRIDALTPGEVSAPFHTQFGWHIAKVLERRTRDTTDESRRNKARQAIFERKDAEEYEAWLRKLRGEAYVEYRLANGATSTKPSGS
jgi:peptidyl-prolyl cis-trans isomerase SurA